MPNLNASSRACRWKVCTQVTAFLWHCCQLLSRFMHRLVSRLKRGGRRTLNILIREVLWWIIQHSILSCEPVCFQNNWHGTWLLSKLKSFLKNAFPFKISVSLHGATTCKVFLHLVNSCSSKLISVPIPVWLRSLALPLLAPRAHLLAQKSLYTVTGFVCLPCQAIAWQSSRTYKLMVLSLQLITVPF